MAGAGLAEDAPVGAAHGRGGRRAPGPPRAPLRAHVAGAPAPTHAHHHTILPCCHAAFGASAPTLSPTTVHSPPPHRLPSPCVCMSSRRRSRARTPRARTPSTRRASWRRGTRRTAAPRTRRPSRATKPWRAAGWAGDARCACCSYLLAFLVPYTTFHADDLRVLSSPCCALRQFCEKHVGAAGQRVHAAVRKLLKAGTTLDVTQVGDLNSLRLIVGAV